jgi:hypothetical protein
MRRGIETNFKGFKAIAENGELVGPWNPWLHFPKFGGPVWELVKALSTSPSLPKSVREVAVLVTGAQFRSAYEIYAHVLVAEARGLPDDKIATIVAGQRPSDRSFPKIPSGGDSRGEAESGHHLARCSGCSTCLGRSSPTCSSRNAGLKSRTSFSDISSILH